MDHKEAKARVRASLMGGVLMGVPGASLLASVMAKGLYFGARDNCIAIYKVCAGAQNAVDYLYEAVPPFKWLWLNLLPDGHGFISTLVSAPGFVSYAMLLITAKLFGDAAFLHGEIKLAERNARRQKMEESLGGGSRSQSIGTVNANGDVRITQAMDRQIAERVDEKSRNPVRTAVVGLAMAVVAAVLGQGANVLLGLDR